MNKKAARVRRGRRVRAKIRGLGMNRLSVNRTPRHIYAQVISPAGDCVLACASTLDKDFRNTNTSGGNIKAAAEVGRMIAERAKTAGLEKVAFDRSGFKYHGRIKALADAARENGLVF